MGRAWRSIVTLRQCNHDNGKFWSIRTTGSVTALDTFLIRFVYQQPVNSGGGGGSDYDSSVNASVSMHKFTLRDDRLITTGDLIWI